MNKIFLIVFFLPFYAQSQIINVSNNASKSINPCIVTKGNISYFLWVDDGNTNYGIRYKINSGNNWSTIKVIDTPENSYISSFSAEDSAIIHFLWIEGSGMNNRLMYGRIVDSTLVDSIEIFRNDSSNIVFSSCLFDQPTETLQISWDIFSGDSVYTYYSSRANNGTWSGRQIIISNNILDGNPGAQLVQDRNHNVLCLWFSEDSLSINMIRKNFNNWTEGTSLKSAVDGIGRGFVARNDDSLNVHIVSLPGRQLTCPCNFLYYSKWDGSIWSTPETVPSNDNYAYYTEHVSPEICFSKDGYPVISWEQHSWNIYLNLYAKFIGTAVKTDTGWHVNTEITIHPNIENPRIAVDNQDIINYVWQDSSDGDYDIYLYRTSLLTTVESDRNPVVPDKVSLYQNYPNPFNPSTHISFTLPSKGFVSLKVYNLLGIEVTTLFTGVVPAGNHSVSWNASSFTSGVYFYRLQTEQYIETKKLILLR